MSGGMDRPPSASRSSDGMPPAAPFRFLPAEVEEMEARLQPLQNPSPNQVAVEELARKFSASAERIGKVVIYPKQVKTWFANRRYNSREGKAARAVQAQEKSSARGVGAFRIRHLAGGSSSAVHTGSSSGNSSNNGSQVEFEAKSAIDGAWFDVDFFISSRISESGEQELMAKFSGFGVEEAEWVNARTCVRRRSIPFKASECERVKLGQHVLCYKETQHSGLYFDAQVRARKDKTHGPEGCDCTFLVHFEHDQSEETVRVRKLCYRPETYELSK